MAKFYVGQRVRLVRGHDCASKANNYGIEGRIVGFECWPAGALSEWGWVYPLETDCLVLWDGEKIDRPQNTLQLEPVLDQHQPCDADFKESLDKLLEELPA